MLSMSHFPERISALWAILSSLPAPPGACGCFVFSLFSPQSLGSGWTELIHHVFVGKGWKERDGERNNTQYKGMGLGKQIQYCRLTLVGQVLPIIMYRSISPTDWRPKLFTHWVL